MLRIAVLASHQGTNFEAIADACSTGKINGSVVLVISNNSKAPVLDKARQRSIQTAHLSARTHPTNLDFSICYVLITHRVDLIVLAGYMKKLGPITLSAFEGRIINVHPALLPRHGGTGMYGLRVHEAVIESGDTETGVTVHHVIDDYDTGPVILQRKIDVEENDTPEILAERVLKLEHETLIDAVNQFALEQGST